MGRKAKTNKAPSAAPQEAQVQFGGHQHSASAIANAFVDPYYKILRDNPQNTHKFYKDVSTLSLPDADGSVVSVTTVEAINDVIMSSDIKNWDIRPLDIYAHHTVADLVIIGVAGVMSKDNVSKFFSQTFLLAPQTRGYYVHNDFFQFIDACYVNIPNNTDDYQVPTKDKGTFTEEDFDVINQTSANSSDTNIDVPNEITAPLVIQSISNTCQDVEKGSYASAAAEAGSLPLIEEDNDNVIAQICDKSLETTNSVFPDEPNEIIEPVVIKSVSNIQEDVKKESYASVVAKPSPNATIKVSPKTDMQSSAPHVNHLGVKTSEPPCNEKDKGDTTEEDNDEINQVSASSSDTANSGVPKKTKEINEPLVTQSVSNIQENVEKETYAFFAAKASSFPPLNATVKVSPKINMQSSPHPVDLGVKTSAHPNNEKDTTTKGVHEVFGKEQNHKSRSTEEIIDIDDDQAEKNLRENAQGVAKKESYAGIVKRGISLRLSLPASPRVLEDKSSNVVHETTESSSFPAKPSNHEPQIANTIYVKDLPPHVTRRSLALAVKGFGHVKHRNIRIRRYSDGYRYAFVEFHHPLPASQAVQAGIIKFNDWECQVEFKKGHTEGPEGCDGYGSGDNNGNGNDSGDSNNVGGL